MNRNFYNASDFEIKILQRVRFSIKMSSDVEEKYFFEKHDFEENHIFKKHDFEEKFIFKKYVFGEKKNIFEKQILEKVLNKKNHVLIQFTP